MADPDLAVFARRIKAVREAQRAALASTKAEGRMNPTLRAADVAAEDAMLEECAAYLNAGGADADTAALCRAAVAMVTKQRAVWRSGDRAAFSEARDLERRTDRLVTTAINPPKPDLFAPTPDEE